MQFGCLFCTGVYATKELVHEHLIEFIPELLPFSGLTETRTDNHHALDIIRMALRVRWTEKAGLLGPASQNLTLVALAESAGIIRKRLRSGKGKRKDKAKPTVNTATHQANPDASASTTLPSVSHNHDNESRVPIDPNRAVLFVLNVSFPNRVMIALHIHPNTTLTDAVASAVLHEQSLFHASLENAAQVSQERFVFVGGHGIVIGNPEWQRLKRSRKRQRGGQSRVVTVRVKRAGKSKKS